MPCIHLCQHHHQLEHHGSSGNQIKMIMWIIHWDVHRLNIILQKFHHCKKLPKHHNIPLSYKLINLQEISHASFMKINIQIYFREYEQFGIFFHSKFCDLFFFKRKVLIHRQCWWSVLPKDYEFIWLSKKISIILVYIEIKWRHLLTQYSNNLLCIFFICNTN